MKTVITIARQFGSGGHEIGEKLAKQLKLPFYDKELVEIAAKKSNISREVFDQVDEKAANSFLFSLAAGNSMRGLQSPFYYDMPIHDKLFIAQSEVIETAAKEGACVIVGRCADYVLEDMDVAAVNVFIHSDLKIRIDRIAKMYDLSPEKAKEKILKTEKRRKTYYNYYSNREWGKIESYDLCLNSGKIGIDNVVEMICSFVQMKEEYGRI